jgi:hypothetical protein
LKLIGPPETSPRKGAFSRAEALIMGWVEAIELFYVLLVIGIGIAIIGLSRADDEIVEFPFRPLSPHLADKLKIKEAPFPEP